MTTEPKVWAWDIESVEWDRPRCVVAVSNHGDVERFSGPGCLAHMASVMEKAKGQWVAHAGGIYDTLLLSNERDPWQELIMSGSAVLCARDGALRVRDSFRWWLSGLAKVGQYADKIEQAKAAPEHAPGYWHKRDVDRTRIEDLTDAEALAYCESDCRILGRGIELATDYMRDAGARVAWTAGASALSLLETLEPASWRLLDRHALPLDTAVAASGAVRGARVENWARGVVDGVYVYDFKSAYPAAYAFQELPIGARHIDGNVEGGSVYRVRWFWRRRDQIPPVLDMTTGAGAGWCEAWCVPEEIDLLRTQGAEKIERLEGWAPDLHAPIGQVFARRLYQEKERGSFFGKVYLNSLHGKFSESPIKETWTREKPSTWYGPAPRMFGPYWRGLACTTDKRGRVARHIQPLAAAAILGRTRARLMRAIYAVRDAGGEVLYCDTDSIHTTLPPERMPVPLGNKLGHLALEGGPFLGIYVAPKTYALCDPSSGAAVKGAGKGVPWGSLKDGVRSTVGGVHRYRQARGRERGEDFRRLAYEEALRPDLEVEIVKEGITSWASGVRGVHGWRRMEQARTVRVVERGKVWAPAAPPTTWGYRTPDEVLAGARIAREEEPTIALLADKSEDPDPWTGVE